MSYPGIMQDLGSTQPIQGIYRIVQTLTPAAVAAQTTSEQTFNVPGVMPGDSIDINKNSHSAGLGIVNVRASAPNQLAITFMNTTGAGITPPAEQYIIGGQR